MTTRAHLEESYCETNLKLAGDFWLQRSAYSSCNNAMNPTWVAGVADATSRITQHEDSVAPADVNRRLNSDNDDDDDDEDEQSDGITASDRRTSPSPERGRRASSALGNVYRHVPHRERPPFIVERRNARERRRVQAVNGAFMRLRKVVPISSNRGKRVSKVKTLQTAIDYISGLQALLKQADMYNDLDIISSYRYHAVDFIHALDNFDNEF